MQRAVLVGALILMAPSMTACPWSAGGEEGRVEVPEALTGTWSLHGQEPGGPNGEPGMSWFIELELEGSSYVRTGYPRWEETATISKLEQDGDTWRLHLDKHERNGSPVTGEVVSLTLSEDGKTLRFKGKSFTRSPR